MRQCKYEQGIPRDHQTKLDIEDDFCILQFDKRTKSKKIFYHPKHIVPVIKVNAGINKYKDFQTSFCTLIHENKITEDEATCDVKNAGHSIALRATSNSEEQKILLRSVNKISKKKISRFKQVIF